MEAFPFNMNAGGKVRKAIIPIAGYGTRMFPESYFVKKAFLPIVDSNGVVKPVLFQLLSELDEAEIEEIYLIIGEGEEEEYERLFHFDTDYSYEERLPKHLREYYTQIHSIGSKIRFIVQKEKKGFGHAVFQAQKYVKDEPVLLLLGDFIYRSRREESCTKQTILAYNESGGKSVIAVKRIDFSESSHYGVVHGTFADKNPHMMLIDNMVEKPSPEQAKEKLSVEGSCFATFGQYILTPEVFTYLEKQILSAEEKIHHGAPWKEIDLTSALYDRAANGELIGIEVDGRSFDVGIPEMYYSTFTEFGKKDDISV